MLAVLLSIVLQSIQSKIKVNTSVLCDLAPAELITAI